MSDQPFTLVLEAEFVLPDMALKLSDLLTGTVNRYTFSLKVDQHPIPSTIFPWRGVCFGWLVCRPKTLLCGGISANLKKGGEWLHSVQLIYRPSSPWDPHDLPNGVRKFNFYTTRKFESHLPENLNWKIQ